MNKLNFILFASLINLVLAPAVLQAQPAGEPPAYSHFIDDQTLAVARIDLERIDVAAIIDFVRKAAPKESDVARQLPAVEQTAKEALARLSSTGIREIFVVSSLADVGPARVPLFVVARAPAKGDAQQAASLLRETLQVEAGTEQSGLLIAGPQAAIDRLKTARPVSRPEFGNLESAADTAMQIVFAPNKDTRRVVREMLPRLPDEIGGGSTKVLTDGLLSANLAVKSSPSLTATLTIRSQDADAAAALRGFIVSLLQLAGRHHEVRRAIPQFDTLARLLTPQLSGDKLTVRIPSQEITIDEIAKLVSGPVAAAQTAGNRSRSFNHLKMLGIAMHNYHDVYGHFPPQAIRDKSGKALLSWRVALLPYLDEESLYKEFHLDESWDSEHNRRLLERIPDVFASPLLDSALRAKGITNYLAPLSKAPPSVAATAADDSQKPLVNGTNEMIFDVVQGTQIRRITDGTSNTIMVLEVDPKAGVPWTKPDDLVIDERNPLEHLHCGPQAGFASAFADGSARFIKDTVKAQTLMHLLQMNDGQPIGPID
jgi:hypothetical protein